MNSREVALLTLAGGLLPVVTVLAAFEAIATYDVPWIVPIVALLVGPLVTAVGLYRAGVRFGALRTPSWLPTRRERTFADEIPDRYHEEFNAETLRESSRDEPPVSGRLLALGIVYMVSIPVYSAVLWGLFG